MCQLLGTHRSVSCPLNPSQSSWRSYLGVPPQLPLSLSLLHTRLLQSGWLCLSPPSNQLFSVTIFSFLPCPASQPQTTGMTHLTACRKPSLCFPVLNCYSHLEDFSASVFPDTRPTYSSYHLVLSFLWLCWWLFFHPHLKSCFSCHDFTYHINIIHNLHVQPVSPFVGIWQILWCPAGTLTSCPRLNDLFPQTNSFSRFPKPKPGDFNWILIRWGFFPLIQSWLWANIASEE